MMSLSILDWVIVLIVLLSVLQAIANGFLREFFEFVGVVAAYLIAAWEYRVVARWFSRFMGSPWPANIVGFLVVFLVVMVLAGAVGKILSRVVKSVGLSWFDRVLGAAFGFVRGIVVGVVLVLALAALAPQWGLAQSRLAPVMLSAGRTLIWAAPLDFRQRFWDGWKLLRTVPEHLPGHSNNKGSSQSNSTP
jgi:membrane protein required for colicin V production